MTSDDQAVAWAVETNDAWVYASTSESDCRDVARVEKQERAARWTKIHPLYLHPAPSAETIRAMAEEISALAWELRNAMPAPDIAAILRKHLAPEEGGTTDA